MSLLNSEIFGVNLAFDDMKQQMNSRDVFEIMKKYLLDYYQKIQNKKKSLG